MTNDDDLPVKPLMSDQPEDDEELRTRRRAVRREADQDLAIRGAVVSGALGGNAGQVAGALVGTGGALAIEETQAETYEPVRSEAEA